MLSRCDYSMMRSTIGAMRERGFSAARTRIEMCRTLCGAVSSCRLMPMMMTRRTMVTRRARRASGGSVAGGGGCCVTSLMSSTPMARIGLRSLGGLTICRMSSE